MNDEFLTKFHTPPRPAFAHALYERISQQKPSFASQLAGKLTLRNALMGLAALVLVVACVRAATAPRWVKVGDIWVEVKPYTLITEVPRITTVDPSRPVTTQYTLSDVTDTFDGAVKLPSWLPEGYKFDAVYQLTNLATDKWASLGWDGAAVGEHIQLIAHSMVWWNTQRYAIGPAYTYGAVAPGSYREVKVNGQSAVLVRGDWDWVDWNDGDWQQPLPIKVGWDKKAAIQLYWVDGEWLYLLIASPDLSAQDLIRIAESAQ